MRKPRPEDYSSHIPQRQPDQVNTAGLIPLAPKPNPAFPLSGKSHTSPEMPASLQASNIASKQTSLLAAVRAIGDLKATNAATFRFPPDLLDKLEEVEYRLRKNHKIKVTKNALIVGSLAFLLLEYEEKDIESVLYQYLLGE